MYSKHKADHHGGGAYICLAPWLMQVVWRHELIQNRYNGAYDQSKRTDLATSGGPSIDILQMQ